MSIWATVPTAPPNAIFNLNTLYNNDSDTRKLNLGVGAYRDSEGSPYVFEVVKQAEKALYDGLQAAELNKEYLPIRGDDNFAQCAKELLYGSDSIAIKENRIGSVQSISGTGALRLAGEFLSKWGGKPTVYLSNPTWGNHATIFKGAGLNVETYNYYDPSTLGVNFKNMVASLQNAPAGSVICLHMCCHNPTGADLGQDEWKQLADFMEAKKLIPMFDCAYQGFATGDVDVDAFPIRHFVSRGFECISCQSFSKNMGLYNERAGLVSYCTKDSNSAAAAKSQLEIIVRHMYSNPPAHGAWIAGHVLSKLGSEWRRELAAVTGRIIAMREALQKELIKIGTPGSWDHITKQQGMFCFSGLNKDQSEAMINQHHIYMLSNGRINCAALKPGDIEYLAACIKNVLVTKGSSL